jgi:hypothetical protein
LKLCNSSYCSSHGITFKGALPECNRALSFILFWRVSFLFGSSLFFLFLRVEQVWGWQQSSEFWFWDVADANEAANIFWSGARLLPFLVFLRILLQTAGMSNPNPLSLSVFYFLCEQILKCLT